MKERIRLYFTKDIYNHEKTDSLFLAAVKKNIAFHKARCKPYREILNAMDFDLNQLKDMESLFKLPFIPTLYLKRNRLLTLNPRWLPVKATSSGTSGAKSHIGYNTKLLLYSAVMVLKMATYHKILSIRPTNYIILGYQPHPDNQTIITKTQGVSTLFAPPKRKEYALKHTGKGYEADYHGIKEALKEYARGTAPVRLVGFPSYTLFLLQELEKEHISYVLPRGSMVLLGGGWKGFYKEKVEKEILYQKLEKILGIPERNCREFFGVAEHPVLFCSCPNHHFHVPNFGRVIIRDVQTLMPVKNGEPGLVNLLSPAADSMPLTSIVTDDIGILYDGEACGCGIKTPYIEIIGRVGVRGVQTCGISAAELLKGVR